MKQTLLPAALACGLLAVACGGAAPDVRPDPARGVVSEIAPIPPAFARLSVAMDGQGGTRVAVFGESDVSIWRAVPPAPWTQESHDASTGVGALAPAGAPIVAAIVTNGGVSVIDAAGRTSMALALQPGENVADLAVTGDGIAILRERWRSGTAEVTVLFGRFGAASVEAPVSLLSYQSAPAQSAIAACTGAAGAQLVVATTRSTEVQRRVSSVTTLQGLRFDRTAGQWSSPATIVEANGDQDFGREMVVSPQSLSMRCDTAGADVLVRGGAGWLLHNVRDDEWSVPRRVLPYGAGPGMQRRAAALCGDRAVWIDNRLERGDSGAWSLLRGFPWSDSYQGWGISAVYTAALRDLETGSAAALLLSPGTGAAHAVAAAPAADGGCAVAWAGLRRVARAGGSAGDLTERSFITRVEPPR